MKPGQPVGELTRVIADRVLERMTHADREQILLQAIVENIPVGLAVVDNEGTPLIVNTEALRTFGKDDPADFAGWHEGEAYRMDGTRVLPAERPIARTLATGEVILGEMLELVIDGRHTVFEISSAPIVDAVGEQIGGLSIFRDVTVRQATELAERDFVTNAAHELQSPLAAIVSAIEVLQAGAKDGPEREIFLSHIEREADRLARLVHALLILARTETGIEAPRDEIVALCPLLTDAAQALTVAADVELVVDCPEDLAVLTNRELVEQAVANLATNAAKMTKSGRIVLGARATAEEMIEITVMDTGPGIPAADRPRIFERFFRGDPGASPGFGLGLAIVRSVAEALHGELELDSTVGEGTIVRLRLPKAANLVSP